MDWFLWLVVGMWALSAVSSVATVGKPRKPIEPRLAAVIVVVNAAMVVGLVVTR